jgi:hypothetical protein
MVADDEKLMVLKMVQEGKLSPEEGLQLLQMLDTADDAQPKTPVDDAPAGQAAAPRWFRMRVTEINTGKPRINMRLPIGLVNAGLKMGMRFTVDKDDLDMDSIRQALKEGAVGEIIDVTDERDGERTEIFIE